jgi:subtilisin family serine protease
LGSLEGFIKLDLSNSRLSPTQIETTLAAHPDVLWFERQYYTHFPEPKAFPGSPELDPGFGQSWHIVNAGQRNGKRGEDINMLPVWDMGFTGSNIIVGVIDTGTQINHPDLMANVRRDLTLDLIDNQSQIHSLDTDENHGTAVSGIIASVDNELGGIGVAYRSSLAPIRYIGQAQSDANSSQALSHANQFISIYNNSWGPAINPEQELVALLGPGNLGRLAIETSANEGRQGRGNIYLFAAGNDHQAGDSVNYNGWANLRQVIPVGAIGNQGSVVSYSERGSALFITAPSGGQSLGIYSTDRTGSEGYDPSDFTTDFSGTSAATPIVAGVVATMLEARPELTWRDVQHILAHTAVQIDSEDDSWQINGAGLPVSEKYGFGRIDAMSAVQASLRWQLVDPARQLIESRSVVTLIPNNNGRTLSSSIEIEQNLKVEHVTITFESSHTDWGDLSIVLVSPSGTRSPLAYPHNDFTKQYSSWDYSSVFNWDEPSQGTWRLEVTDAGTGGTGSLLRWSIEIYGTEIRQSENASPILSPDSFIGTEFPVEIPVLANDIDPDGDPINISSLYTPEFGNLSLTQNQALVYTPLDTFQGIDQFGYSVTDPQGRTSDTLVSILDPRPVPVTDQVVIPPGANIAIPAIENDFDRSGDPLFLVSAEAQNGGTALVQENFVVYAPFPGSIGLEEINYTVTDQNDGPKTGLIRAFASGQNDFALTFDGVDDQVLVNYDPIMDVGSEITLEAAFYLTDWGENGEVGFGRIVDRGAYRMYTNGENHSRYPDHSLVVQLVFPNGLSMNINSLENTLQLNRWHTVALSYNGSSYEMFIDGQKVETQVLYGSLGGPIAPDNQDLYIGENTNGDRAFAGIIDWVRIWNVKRTDEQLTSAGINVPESDRKGLVGWYQFNEGVGFTTQDSSNNLSNGSVSEALWSPKDPSLLSLVLTR